MIFINNLLDLLKVDKNSYYHNKEYGFTTLYKYYDSVFTGYQGKRILINNNKLETGKGVLHRENKYLDGISNKIDDLKSKQQLSIDNLFVFTDDYGDRNICHWMTEQLLVLNYLIDIMYHFDSTKERLWVVINKNRKHSMFNIIKDYLYKIPLLNSSRILEMDFQTGEIFDYDSVNNIYSSTNNFGFNVNNLYIGNAIKNNLFNIYHGWDKLHSRLVINESIDSNDSNSNTPSQITNMYMSRRNLLDPSKKTNTRIMENLEQISLNIVFKNYTEVYTDELNTLDDRINLFKNVKTIVCELGAGMHNLLYCNEGVNLYVMFQKNNYSWLQEYFPLFEKKKMRVTLLVGETTSHEHNGNWLNTPWKLDLTEMNKLPICN